MTIERSDIAFTVNNGICLVLVYSLFTPDIERSDIAFTMNNWICLVLVYSLFTPDIDQLHNLEGRQVGIREFFFIYVKQLLEIKGYDIVRHCTTKS